LPQPLVVRRATALASAVYEGHMAVEGVTACLVRDDADIAQAWEENYVPVIVDPTASIARKLAPLGRGGCDHGKTQHRHNHRRCAHRRGIGPGFCAGVDCHAVVETQRGPNLGRVYFTGMAAPIPARQVKSAARRSGACCVRRWMGRLLESNASASACAQEILWREWAIIR